MLDKMLLNLVKQLGISPEELVAGAQAVLAEVEAIKSDRLSFKAASGSVAREFRDVLARQDNRLAALESGQAEILAALKVVRFTLAPEPASTSPMQTQELNGHV